MNKAQNTKRNMDEKQNSKRFKKNWLWEIEDE